MRRIDENPQIMKMTVKNMISILGEINASVKEKTVAILSAYTLFKAIIAVKMMTISS